MSRYDELLAFLATHVHAEDDARSIVNLIEGTDWLEALRGEIQRKREARDIALGQMVACMRCGSVEEMRSMTYLSHIPSISYKPYCDMCAQAMRSLYEITCVICSQQFIAKQPIRLAHFCPSCWTEERVHEAYRVDEHNKRAVALGLTGDLTLSSWFATLDHFKWHCAYCGGAFQVLEHFVSITQGGATTAKNCVPACYSCNNAKGNGDSHWSGRSMHDDMRRVSAYLTQL